MTMQFPQAQIVQVPFRTATLDESIDPKQAPPGTLLALRNAVWVKAGRVEKRPGTAALSTALVGGGSLPGAIRKLWTRDGELLATDGDDVYSWVAGQSLWKRVHSLEPLDATWKKVSDTYASVEQPDIDADEDTIAECWIVPNRTDLYVQVTDAVTGAKILAATRIQNASHARCLVKGTKVIVVYLYSNVIYARTVDLTTGALSGATTLRTSVANVGSALFDVAHNGPNWTLLYREAAGNLRLFTYNSSLVEQANATVASSGNIYAMSLHATTGENLYVVYAEAATFLVRMAVHNPSTLAQTLAPVTVYTGTAQSYRVSVIRETASSCIVAFTERLSTTSEQTITYKVSSLGVVDTDSQRNTYWARLASKLFTIDGRFYMMLVSIRPAIQIAGVRISQNTTFGVEADTSFNGGYTNLPHRLAAIVSPRESALPTYFAPLPSAPVVSDVAYAAALSLSEPLSLATYTRNGLTRVTMTTSLADSWRSAAIGRSLVMAGGAPAFYDGRQAFAVNFLHAPRVISATPGAAGSMAAGTYQYVFVYEWRDATGLLHRSIPSQPTSVTVGASGSVAFVLECASTSGRTDVDTGADSDNAFPVKIIPYRTTVGGSTFYRLAVEPATGSVLNDPRASSVNYTDLRSDSSIDGLGTTLATRPLLYTTGGILDEVMPPSFTTCILHRGRIFGVAGDQRTIWFSKEYTEDPGVFPGFHENLRIVIDEDITAIASLDEKLVAFTEGSIWIVVGDGPNAAGIGSFDVPIPVQSDVGAIDARSVVETPDGVMFLSRRGLYILTRDLQVDWIGRAVVDQLASYPNIIDALLVPHRNQIRFACEGEGENEGTGIVLVYDYVNRFWSVFDYWDGDSSYAAIRSSVVSGSTLYMTNGASVVSEDDASWLDRGSQWVTLEFELMLQPLGPIAWQHMRRLQLLGERKTNHDLRLRLAFNDSSSFAQDFTFTSAKVSVNNDCPTVRIGSQNGANPKCKSLRVRVTDATPTEPGDYPVSTGRGGWFSALGLELIPKPGLPRHGARYSKV